jgi:GLPGLI family protein
MRWIILFSGGLMLSAVGATAQQPDTAQVLVHYKFSHVRDTNNRAHPYTENMVLLVGKHGGVYRSYDFQLSVAQDKKKMQEAIAGSVGGNVRFNRQVTGSGTEYYQFPNDGKMLRKERMFGSYLITGSLPAINWQISGDTATFGGLHCQKATCHFKGRDYTTWFCPDLPLHIGPWELNGLPGVIVEAFDATGDVRFMFEGVETAVVLAKTDDQGAGQAPGGRGPAGQGGMPPLPGMDDGNSDPDIIKVPENATKTTDKEFAKLQEAFRKDPNAFVQSMMAAQPGGMAGGGGMPGAKGSGPGGSGMKIDIKAGPGPVINNPIELPENK